MKKKKTKDGIKPLATYVLLNLAAVFLVEANWLMGAVFLAVALLLSFLYLRLLSQKEDKRKAKEEKASFLQVFFSSYSLNPDGREALKAALMVSPELCALNYDDMVSHKEKFGYLTDGIYQEAFDKALEGKLYKTSAANAAADLEAGSPTDKKNDFKKKQWEFFMSGSAYSWLFVAIKLIYAKNLIDYENPFFMALYLLFSLLPLILASVYSLSEGRKKR